MRILLAEDDARLAEPLRDFLARDQHVVTWVDHGGRALEEILASDYDLALLDWMLPGRDGLAIVTELRRRQRPTLVLMLTARDALEDVVQGLQAGADDYLVKPLRRRSWPPASARSNAAPPGPTAVWSCTGAP